VNKNRIRRHRVGGPDVIDGNVAWPWRIFATAGDVEGHHDARATLQQLIGSLGVEAREATSFADNYDC
jgi:hypothetical protein